ncbi:phage major capsid protein [Bifidobacterium sp. ESL0775]|uniref:phage major capsid protein n=1 Tax=Bifidobacterium sp. ESL0775 TaxID=2983230 RepID=UPI0023F773D0|nr:phage major capsid protein [Bifidobacterium sp. ESL0775]WEV68723.1 phage major capsid protein [Bifidobacterium sp. ESL0775]
MATLKEKRAAAYNQLKEYQAKLKDGGDSLSDDDVKNINDLIAQVGDLDEKISKANETAGLVGKIAALGDDGPTPASEGDGSEPKQRTPGSMFAKKVADLGGHLKADMHVEYKANSDTQTVGGHDGAYGPYITDIDREAVMPYQRPLVIADLFGSGTVSGNVIEYPVFGSLEGTAKTVGEGKQKSQVHLADPTWVTDALKEVAAFFKVSDNMLEDLEWLQSEVNDYATYNLREVEEDQLLNGDGVDTNIKGLFSREIQTLGQSDDSDADRLFKTFAMISNATKLNADGIVINPKDYEALRLGKDSNGQYYGGGYFGGQYGNGAILQQPPIWGLRTVVTAGVPIGTALVGAFAQGGKVFRKNGLRIDSTNSHEDDFTNDKVTVRIKERLGLQVKYPKAFVKVTLGQASAPKSGK